MRMPTPGCPNTIADETAAEEDGGGKVYMIRKGAYRDFAACLMLHPAGKGPGAAVVGLNAKRQVKVEFTGKPAHAGGNPAGACVPLAS